MDFPQGPELRKKLENAARVQASEQQALETDAERLLDTVTSLLKRVHIFSGLCAEDGLHFDEDVYKGPKVTKSEDTKKAPKDTKKARDLLLAWWVWQRYSADRESWIARGEAVRDELIEPELPPYFKTMVWVRGPDKHVYVHERNSRNLSTLSLVVVTYPRFPLTRGGGGYWGPGIYFCRAIVARLSRSLPGKIVMQQDITTWSEKR